MQGVAKRSRKKLIEAAEFTIHDYPVYCALNLAIVREFESLFLQTNNLTFTAKASAERETWRGERL